MEYTVYVKANEQDLIFSIDSSDNLTDTDGWIEIDKGVGDKYKKAQTQYLGKRLFDDRMTLRYKLVDGEVVERTQEEMDADYVPPEPVTPLENRVDAVEIKTGDLEEALDMILSGVTE